MIDFTQIETGEDFELLCEDLLQAMGYTIEASVSRGPDLGRDIIVSKTMVDKMGFAESYRYLIECKHYAKSGKSVQEADIGNPIARLGTHECNRYILVTSTVPSEKVRIQLAVIPNIVPGYKATIWAKNHLVQYLEQYPWIQDRYFGLAFAGLKSKQVDEERYCLDVLVPLLRDLGFVDVRYVHGWDEHGRDIVFSHRNKFGIERHIAAQVKAKRISGGARSQIESIIKQISDSFLVPYFDMTSKQERYISELYFITSESYTRNAQKEILSRLTEPAIRNNVHFFDGEKIRELVHTSRLALQLEHHR